MQQNSRRSPVGVYIDLWKECTWHMLVTHCCLLAILLFFVSEPKFRAGEITWALPAFSLLTGILMSTILILSGGTDEQ